MIGRLALIARGLGRYLAATVQLRDVFFFGGLGLAAYGGQMLSVPWTLIATGVVFATLGKFGR